MIKTKIPDSFNMRAQKNPASDELIDIIFYSIGKPYIDMEFVGNLSERVINQFKEGEAPLSREIDEIEELAPLFTISKKQAFNIIETLTRELKPVDEPVDLTD